MDAKTSINCCIYVVNYVPKDIIMVFLGYIMIFSRVHYQKPLFIYIYCLKRCVLRVGAARGVVHCLTTGGGAAEGGIG